MYFHRSLWWSVLQCIVSLMDYLFPISLGKLLSPQSIWSYLLQWVSGRSDLWSVLVEVRSLQKHLVKGKKRMQMNISLCWSLRPWSELRSYLSLGLYLSVRSVWCLVLVNSCLNMQQLMAVSCLYHSRCLWCSRSFITSLLLLRNLLTVFACLWSLVWLILYLTIFLSELCIMVLLVLRLQLQWVNMLADLCH